MAIRVRLQPKRANLEARKQRLSESERVTTPGRVYVPAEPTYAREGGDKGERALHDEQQVARVELMMLKGVRNRQLLMTTLDVEDPRVMDRYIKRVHARWELGGVSQEFARHRGEGLSRLDLIESEIWSKLGNLDDRANPQVPLNYLKALLDVSKHRAELLGLTPKVIAHIGALDDGTSEVAGLNRDNQRMVKVLGRIQSMIDERTSDRVIEHVPSPSEA